MNARTERRILAVCEARGVLRTSEAKDIGIDRGTLKRAADAGVIHRVGRGKYVAADTPAESLQAQASAVGDDAVLGYRGAAAYYGLDAIDKRALEWIVPHAGSRPRGLPANLHQRRRFDDLQIVNINGLYVTSVCQTLADLGAVVDADIVERVAESALRMNLVDELVLRDFANLFVFSRHGGPTLRAVLDRRPIGAKPTGSDIETRLLQVYRAGGVPTPQRQWAVYDKEGTLMGYVDCGFPPLRFGTEVDGFESHGTPAGLQYDRNRQNRIEDTGFSLRRFTFADVARRHRYVCTETLRGLALARM